MNSIDIGACISTGWETFKKDPLNHILALVLIGVCGSISMGILSGPMMVGYTRMLMREAEGQRISAGDVFKGFDDFVPGLVAALLSSLIISVGYTFLVIPGILLAPLLPYTIYFVAAGEKDGIEALKRAFQVLQAQLVPGALCVFVLGIVGALGVLGCCVGLLATMPIAAIGNFVMCRQILGHGAPSAAGA